MADPGNSTPVGVSDSESLGTVNDGKGEYVKGHSEQPGGKGSRFEADVVKGAMLKNDELTVKGKSKEEDKSTNAKVPLLRLFSFADRIDVVLIIVGTISAAANGASQPVMTLLLGQLINAFGKNLGDINKLVDAVNSVVLRYVYVGIAAGVCGYLQVACWTVAGERQSARIRSGYLRAILRQDISFFDTDTSTGEVVTRMSGDTVLIQDGLGEKVAKFTQLFATFVGGFIVAFIKSWKLTLVLMAVMPILAVCGVTTVIFISKTVSRSQEAYAGAGSLVEQVIGAIRTVASYTGEREAVEDYDNNLKGAEKAGILQGLVGGCGAGILIGAMCASYALALWYGSKLVLNDGLDGGRVINVIFAVITGTMSLSQASPSFAAVASAQAAAYNLFEVIKRNPSIDIYDISGLVLEKLKGDVELRNVEFCYPTRLDVKVFSNFSLAIPAGKTVALVGESGCGKSTVISLIERFYDPRSGSVLVDGLDIRTIQLKWLRQQIGLVSQEPVLFSTSIKENIAYGKENATDEEIETASELANAAKFITKLPQAYNTLVGERGIQLSGGQKQRVAIARAILKNPRILLLDEATSALDAESERIVQEALDKVMVNRTTVVVAHRLTTIRNATTIAVVQRGAIVESGPHIELIRNPDGAYSQLVRLQQEHGRNETVEEKPKQPDIVSKIVESENSARIRRNRSSATGSFRASLNVIGFPTYLGHSDRLDHIDRMDTNNDEIVENETPTRRVRGLSHSFREAYVLDGSLRWDRNTVESALESPTRGRQDSPSASASFRATINPTGYTSLHGSSRRTDRNNAECGDCESAFSSRRHHSSANGSFRASSVGYPSLLGNSTRSDEELGSDIHGRRSESMRHTDLGDETGKEGQLLKTAAPKDVSIFRLAKLNQPEAHFLVIGSLASAAVGLVFPVFGLLLSGVISSYFEPPHQLREDINFWSLMFAVMAIGIAVVSPVQKSMFATAGEKLIRRVRRITFQKILCQEIGWFDEENNSSGALSARLAADAAAVRGIVGDALSLIVQNIATVAAAVVIAFAACWQLALVILALIPILGLEVYGQVRWMRGFSEDAKVKYEEASRLANDGVGSIRTVASFVVEERISNLYDEKCKGPLQNGIHQGLISGISLGFSNLVLFCTFALSFWVGGKLVKAGDATFKEVFRVFFAISLSSLGVTTAAGSAPDFAKVNVAVNSIFSVLDRKSKMDPSDMSGKTLKEAEGVIEFRAVSFAYPTRPDVQVFKSLSFRVDSGKTLALVGESGSGKSTVVSLIERFYEPQSGEILVDGVDIRTLQLKWLRQQIGLVSQEPVLFDESVRWNIVYGQEGRVAESEVQAAAEAANAHRFIAGLPEGYGTRVGERGSLLSGGQKQRVAIARAILRDPKMLLLDEATSALDAESEYLVQEALDRIMVDRTTVVVAHRLSTVRNADIIAVVKDGAIVEQGSHAQLIAHNGAYAAMVKLHSTSS